MALTFAQIREDVRGTDFLYRGQPIDLHGSIGERLMSKTRLDILIHEAGREVQAEIRDRRNVKHFFMRKGVDVIATPPDMLILSKIVVYDDDNPTTASGTHGNIGDTAGAYVGLAQVGIDLVGSSTIAEDSPNTLIDLTASFGSTAAVGYRVDNITDGSSALIVSVDGATQVTTENLIGGLDNLFQAGDEYEIYDPNAKTTKQISDGFELQPAMGLDTLREQREIIRVDEEIISPAVPSEGMPQRFMLLEQDAVQFFLWDVKPDARYFLDVMYYPTLPDMDTDDTTLKMRQIFQSLFYLRAVHKVALRLRDFEAANQFLQNYEITLQKLRGVTKARSLPMPRFHLMP